MKIIAQIFGVIALIIMLSSYQQKTKKKFLLAQITANIYYTIQWILLRGYSATVVQIVSTIRALIFYKYTKNKQEIPIYWLIIAEIITIIMGGITYQNIYSIIPIIIGCLYTYGTWQKDLKKTYTIGIIASLGWIIYNILIGAYIAAVCSVLELISSAKGLSKLNKKKKHKILRSC